MDQLPKLLILGGVILIIAGLLWQFSGKYIPLGRLPGDITVAKENFKFYFPLASSIVISILLSFILWLFLLLRQ